MGSLTSGVQRFGTNITASSFVCTGSIFDVAATTIIILDNTGGFKSWKQGRASFLNNLPGTNKDEIPAYTAFLVLPGSSITTDDTKFSFGTVIPTGSGSETSGNAFSSGFGA